MVQNSSSQNDRIRIISPPLNLMTGLDSTFIEFLEFKIHQMLAVKLTTRCTRVGWKRWQTVKFWTRKYTPLGHCSRSTLGSQLSDTLSTTRDLIAAAAPLRTASDPLATPLLVSHTLRCVYVRRTVRSIIAHNENYTFRKEPLPQLFTQARAGERHKKRWNTDVRVTRFDRGAYNRLRERTAVRRRLSIHTRSYKLRTELS